MLFLIFFFKYNDDEREILLFFCFNFKWWFKYKDKTRKSLESLVTKKEERIETKRNSSSSYFVSKIAKLEEKES